MAEIPEENPFDLLAAIVKPAKSYEEARKCIWTAMRSGNLPEEKIITVLISATAMPALAAANIRMESLLREMGALEPEPQEAAPEAELPKGHILKFPSGKVVN